MTFGRVLFAAALLVAAAVACTVEVKVPTPVVVVHCFEVNLPGGQTSTECVDAGEDALAE